MPTTVKQIAEACGVSKATVRRKLADLGLNNDQHVTVSGQRHIVSDHAASAVAAALSGREAPAVAASGAETVEGMYERYIALLEADKASLAAQLAEKDRQISDQSRQIAELSAQVAEIASKLAESQRKPSIWDRLLPSRSRG